MNNPADERVTVVDEHNVVVGSTTRREMRARRLPHRSTYIVVFNSQDEIFVHKRTDSKDVFPGYYDVAAGGVVLAQEDYEESARRELAEELGIHDAPLQHQFVFYYSDARTRVWGAVYTCLFDGPMVLQREEIESGEFMSVEEALARANRLPFTPDGLYVLRRLLGREVESPGGENP